ncbi:uncharacterized protein SPAPADRAFT_66723 [Spathaspora passalidarum NRRL Y-27907]|uniref:Uncharacterized protein n=1 Tax=Spathaspora passalidarum (strain NRRL Y-27907 / 11-Y1) TaxID=619300 RepID=G3AP26_SPAPN|nr:uncharacterized protein SPAPADRAFT_66723 [Spathaspora passalidarum NRRL Y-27907]EGW32057.1 hypothetical protein SPAPADRAFT_66723 [Spathaspora passalidarum NRRL Y-27907]
MVMRVRWSVDLFLSPLRKLLWYSKVTSTVNNDSKTFNQGSFRVIKYEVVPVLSKNNFWLFRNSKKCKIGGRCSLSNSYGTLIINLENANAKLQNQLHANNEKLNQKYKELSKTNAALVTVKELAYLALEKTNQFQDQISEIRCLKLQQGDNQAELVEESNRFRSKLKKLGLALHDLSVKLETQTNMRSENQVKLEKQELITKNLEATIDELSGNLSEEKFTVASLQQKLAQNSDNEVK